MRIEFKYFEVFFGLNAGGIFKNPIPISTKLGKNRFQIIVFLIDELIVVIV